MASGFIIMKDGRCFARKADVYDYVIKTVIEELRRNGRNSEFMQWLASLIPADNDIDMGYGFIRYDSGEELSRWLDLRELTADNQKAFWTSLQDSLNRNTAKLNPESQDKSTFNELLVLLLRMNYLAEIEDNPDNLSDWQKGYTEPYSNNRVGPGW